MLWSLRATIEKSTSWHGHDNVEYMLCQAGSGQLELEERCIDLLPGRTFYLAPGIRHRYVVRPGEKADIKFLCLNAQDIATYLAPAQIAALEGMNRTLVSHADHPGQTHRVTELAAMIPDAFNIDDVHELSIAWGAIGLLLALHCKACEISEDHSARRYRLKIRGILGWIDTRLHEGLSLEKVCAEFGLSRSLLTREFRRHTGKSFIDYCNGRRIEKAALILATSGESVTKAALESGFSNLSHFHRQFKAIYGLTPVAFRRQVLGG